MILRRLVLWCLLLLFLPPAAWPAAAPSRRIAFLVDSWYPWSHADVIGTRFLEGYRLRDRAYPSPLTVAAVYTEAPRQNDQTRTLAARYGFRVAASVADALVESSSGRARLAVDGILIATREDVPERGQGASPTPRLQLVRQVLRLFAQTGARVPIFVDKLLAANWADSQAIVAEAAQAGVPLMAGSVLPFIPLDRPVRAGRAEVVVAAASTPFRAFGIHAAEFLQGFMEQRGPRETGIGSVQEVGTGYWSRPDRERWGGRVLDSLLAGAQTRRTRGGTAPGSLGPETHVLLIQYADGSRATLAFIPRLFDDKEFLLGALSPDGGIGAGGLVLRAEPYDHFGYLVHALAEFYTTGRPPVPAERTLLTTGLVLAGQQARETGARVDWAGLAVSYPAPRRTP